MNKIVDEYISLAHGYKIDDTQRNKIKNIVGYLYDNNYDEKFIIEYLLKNGLMLKDELWKDSLLKPNTFYYHNQLRISCDCAIWSVGSKEQSSKFFIEMKINYTIDDLLDYFYCKLKVPNELRELKRDLGAFRHMLSKKYLSDVESIDFILALIDYNKEEMLNDRSASLFITNPFDLKYQRETYNRFKYIIENTKHKQIVWRDYNDSM